jgi:PAS domain S-box-containing protein
MPPAAAEQLLDRAVAAVRSRQPDLQDVLEGLAAPVYVTDTNGRITAFNNACIRFSGRTPEAGLDRWCVTWRLYTQAGEPLAHEDCPMAAAIREQRPVRGIEAVAERPDGSRRPFLPFPTPVFDEDGALAGAVNLFVDLSDRKRAEYLRGEAKRCRRLADTIGDRKTVETLHGMAGEYEARADEAETAD